METPMEARIARLEADIAYLRTDVADVKADVRTLRDKIDALGERFDAKFDALAQRQRSKTASELQRFAPCCTLTRGGYLRNVGAASPV
jgi:uncharacterized coiled-coil protein SlyX